MWIVVYRNLFTDEAKSVTFDSQKNCESFLDIIEKSRSRELVSIKSEVELW